jgi:hypothetical protein
MSVIIKNTKNLSRHINNTSILNALSHLKFYRIKNDELEELSVGINSTVSKMGFNEKLTIGPLSEIVLSQEILLADTNLFNLVTLSRYTGYALVLEDEGIFMPISGADMEIVIQAKLRYDNYIIESNIIHLKTMFSKTTDKP